MSMQQDMQGLGSASRRVGAQVTVVDRRALAPAGPGCAYRGQRCTGTLYDACTTGVWCAWGIHASADNELVASCYFHIPPNLVVDHWTSDGESSSHRDVLL